MDSPWYFAVLTGLAGCLGWGIRGVFGHQMGAMVPGAMMGAALMVAAGRGGDSAALLVVAVSAAGFSIGGIESYGQTVGLMHDEPRSKCYWRGFVGCFLKGGLWWGIGGALVAPLAHGDALPFADMVCMAVLAMAAGLVGKRLLNSPLRPPERYPLIYFSHRATDAEDLKRNPPRQEYWGALLFGLAVIVAYSQWVLPCRLVAPAALFGVVGGGLGFALGEALQAWGRWRRPLGESAQPWVDWWKVMEMTFGLVGGAALGLGFGLAVPRWGPERLFVHDSGPAWREGLFLAWVVVWVAAADGCRPAQRLRGVPLLSGMALAAAASAPSRVGHLLVWGFIPYIISLTNLQRWGPQIALRSYRLWHTLLALGSAALGWGVLQDGLWPRMTELSCDPGRILLGTAVIQTLFTFSHALAERGPGSFRERLSRMGSAWSVEVGFVVLCAMLWGVTVMK